MEAWQNAHTVPEMPTWCSVTFLSWWWGEGARGAGVPGRPCSAAQKHAHDDACCTQYQLEHRARDHAHVIHRHQTEKEQKRERKELNQTPSRRPPLILLPGPWASPERTSVMLLGSLWDLPRCTTHSSSSPSDGDAVDDEDDAMVEERRRRGGGDLF